LSVIRKPDAAAQAAGGSPGIEALATTPEQRTLVSLLEMAFGSMEPVGAIVAQALIVAGREELPPTPGELVAFVRAHLLTPLSDHIGPRLTMALVDDLIAQVDPSAAHVADPSIPPSSMPRPVRAALRERSGPAPVRRGVLLVDADRVGRTAVARALLRASWEVTVVDSPEDLEAALGSGDRIDVVLVDATHPRAQAVVEAVAGVRPDVAVVARSGDAIRTRAVLAGLGVTRLEVRSREAPAEELVDAVRRVVSLSSA
jgi:hypothetical protein